MGNSTVVRRDPVSGQEVILATRRRNRPHQHLVRSEALGPSVVCPFCPGNESQLTEILWQLGEPADWHCRSVINRYPIVTPPTGHHEVIIDTPRHDLSLDQMTPDLWNRLVESYVERYRTLVPDWPYLSLFRNVGKRAGASLQHPHSQLIALSYKPKNISLRQRRLRHLYDKHRVCFLCNAISGNLMADGRLVTKSETYVALVPDAASVPFEVWIVPVSHSSQFGLLDEGGRQGLADMLTDVFLRMGTVLGSFDHNLMLMDSDCESRAYLHWFLRIRPVSEAGGGFEQATGIVVNTSCPEQDAERLRQIV